MQILYNIVAILLVILLIPYFIVRTIREKGWINSYDIMTLPVF